jgi:hypothetical protein
VPSKEEGPECEFADPEAAAASPLGRGVGVAVLVALLTGPALVKDGTGWAAGCEAAGCAADVVPPRLKVGKSLAGLVLGRELVKSGSSPGLRDDATAGCEEAGCAAGALAGVVPEKALAKSDPSAGLKENAADGCEEAGCAAGVCPPKPKVGCLLAEVMGWRVFVENSPPEVMGGRVFVENSPPNSPPVAGLGKSVAFLEGSPNKLGSRALPEATADV